MILMMIGDPAKKCLTLVKASDILPPVSVDESQIDPGRLGSQMPTVPPKFHYGTERVRFGVVRAIGVCAAKAGWKILRDEPNRNELNKC